MFKKILICVSLIFTWIDYGYAQSNDCDKYLKEFNSICNKLINWMNTNNVNPVGVDEEELNQEVELRYKNIESCFGDPVYKKKAYATLDRLRKSYDDLQRRKQSTSNQTSSKGSGGYSRTESSSSSSKPRYGDVNTNNYTVSVNAWQCSKCGVLSKGQQQPGRYDNGNCSIGSTHTYGEANTSRGYQCQKCGRRYYLLNKGRSERGPCCGEFGKCSIGTNHEWRAF
jgi:hypothetical protein